MEKYEQINLYSLIDVAHKSTFYGQGSAIILKHFDCGKQLIIMVIEFTKTIAYEWTIWIHDLMVLQQVLMEIEYMKTIAYEWPFCIHDRMILQ